MSADRPPGTVLRWSVTVAAAAIGLALAAGAVLFLLHGRHWFVRQGYPEVAAIGLGVCEIVAGLLFAWPRTRPYGAFALMAVLGWAAGFHFALRQSTAGLFGWIAAVAVVSLVDRFGGPAR
jgi:hypothetical protein